MNTSTTFTFGVNKASDRKQVKVLLTTLGLVGFFTAIVSGENEGVKAATESIKLSGLMETTVDVLKTQVSGTRGRPALEEQPIHTMLKAMKDVHALSDAEGDIDVTKANRILTRAIKLASSQQALLAERRANFKPSKRIQGTKLLPVLDAGENAKS
jgi:hypothetical protein